MNILDYKTISVEDIVFDTPMKTKNNAYISKAYLKNDSGDKQEVYVQTPRLNLLSGIHKTGNRAFYEVEIDAKHNEFYSWNISNLYYTWCCILNTFVSKNVL